MRSIVPSWCMPNKETFLVVFVAMIKYESLARSTKKLSVQILDRVNLFTVRIAKTFLTNGTIPSSLCKVKDLAE